MLTNRLDDLNFTSEPRPLGISSVGVECSLQAWYHGRVTPDPYGFELAARFELGHTFEAMVLAGLSIPAGMQQFPVVADLGDNEVTGHADGVIVEPDGVILVEVKALSGSKAKTFDKSGIFADQRYWVQTALYADALAAQYELPGFVSFIYRNGDTGKIRELWYTLEALDIPRAKNIAAHNVAVALDTDPPDPQPSFRCNFCSFKSTCKPAILNK